MPKIDLHTHSIASSDGGITEDEYAQLLANGTVDTVAITDHNRIDFALQLHARLGEAIIVGEEISTTEGDLIGLFLTEKIDGGLSPEETAERIKKQGGIVYVPHPFETVRKGLSAKSLARFESLIDVVEVHNGRAVFQNRGPQAATWARLHKKLRAASSDAHGMKGVGASHTVVSADVTVSNVLQELEKARLMTDRPPLHTLLYPKFNRLKHRLRAHK